VHSLDIQTEIKKAMKELSDNPIKLFLAFYFVFVVLMITIMTVVISTYLSAGILFSFNHFSNNNSTPIDITTFVNQNSSNLISIFTNSMLTTGLIIFSALSVFSAQRTLKQSHKEQQIRDIEKRLELFYIPAENIMKVADEYIKNTNTINFLKINDYKHRGYENQSMSTEERAVVFSVEKLKEIEQYRYLAKKETCRLFTKYLYEEENNEIRTNLSKSIERDEKQYVKKLYELKQEE
jgi:hypothetical protein